MTSLLFIQQETSISPASRTQSLCSPPSQQQQPTTPHSASATSQDRTSTTLPSLQVPPHSKVLTASVSVPVGSGSSGTGSGVLEKHSALSPGALGKDAFTGSKIETESFFNVSCHFRPIHTERKSNGLFTPSVRVSVATTVLIENYRFASEWGCNPFSIDTIVFHENSIASVIAELSQY